MIPSCVCRYPRDYDELNRVYFYDRWGSKKLRRYQDHWTLYDFNDDIEVTITHCPFCGRELNV